jgi:hypothetical protein
LLNDGKVLIARGDTGEYYFHPASSSELYDPVTGTWGALANSGAPTVLHTATLLPNGKVLVTGGGERPRRAWFDYIGDVRAVRSGHRALD